jgi:hypothetical protein
MTDIINQTLQVACLIIMICSAIAAYRIGVRMLDIVSKFDQRITNLENQISKDN